METNKNLWGSLTASSLTPPIIIIKEQANFLSVSTSERLKGMIFKMSTTRDNIPDFYKKKEAKEGIDIKLNDFICYDFDIKVRTLDYSLNLIRIVYSILDLYPATIVDYINLKIYETYNEQEFSEALATIIQSKKLSNILSNLLSQTTEKK